MADNERPRIGTATIEGIPPFAEKIEFKFDDAVNVFIGPNAVGKSTLLKLLALEFPTRLIPGFKNEGLNVRSAGNWPVHPNGWPDFSKVPELYLPPVRVGMSTRAKQRVPQRQLRDDSWERILKSSLRSHFEGGTYVYHALQKLYHEDLFGVRDRTRAARVAYSAYACVKDICAEVIVGDYVQNIRTVEELSTDENVGIPAELLNQPVEHYAMGVYTDETDEGDNLYIGELSTGTQGIFIWVFFWAIKMASTYKFMPSWQNQPGILLIDEIENHLHPTWQRRVIPALLKHFPGLQIFATTHSPFVVAGLRAGQVHLLNRDANGVVTASSNAEDIIGWTADEILRVFMGVEDPTDDATAAAARELRQLRDAGPHPDEGQEEQRQARMQELRHLVNRDLLAGGPRAAEDERFAANLAGILERYQLSRDLNQENG